MKRPLKWIVAMCACIVLAIIARFVGTRGDYPVASLVTDDPSLPSESVAGVQLHLKVIDGPADDTRSSWYMAVRAAIFGHCRRWMRFPINTALPITTNAGTLE